MDESECVVKVLITGSHGFIGTWFRKWFAENRPGDRLVCFDTRGDGVFARDVRDVFRTSDVRYDLVIHLAANVGGRLAIDNSPIHIAQNLGIDAALFEFVERTRPGCTVYFSSAAAYPLHLQTDDWAAPKRLHEWYIDLADMRQADMTYGNSKLMGEYLASFARDDGHRVMVFRPFGGYAHNQTLDYPWTTIAMRAIKQEHPLEVWGCGDQKRDFIHVTDIVNAVMAAYDQGFTGTANLCTGRGTSFLELAALFAEEVGYAPLIKPRPEMPQGVYRRVGSPMVMNSFYLPKITLEEGVCMTVKELS